MSEVQETPNPKDLLSAAFDDPDYHRFVKIAEGQIWSGCFGFSVVSICINVYIDKACAELRFVGITLDETCSTWRRDGDILRTSIGLGTQNSGVWKLEDPRINFEHNLATDRGSARFSATLYELTWRGYRERKKWDNELILSW